MAYAEDVVTRIINISGTKAEPGPPIEPAWHLWCEHRFPVSDINGVVSSSTFLSCGNFLSDAGITPGSPVDLDARYIFYYADYGGSSQQIREVWIRIGHPSDLPHPLPEPPTA